MKRQTKRWRRLLFNTLTAISLLLAIATAGLWVRSVFANDIVIRDISHWTGNVVIANLKCGHVRLEFLTQAAVERYGPLPNTFVSHSPDGGHFWNRVLPKDGVWLRTTVLPHSRDSLTGSVSIGCPLGLPALIASISPALVVFIRHRHESQVDIKHCPACGYDMRANPAKCSECGHESKPVAA